MLFGVQVGVLLWIHVQCMHSHFIYISSEIDEKRVIHSHQVWSMIWEFYIIKLSIFNKRTYYFTLHFPNKISQKKKTLEKCALHTRSLHFSYQNNLHITNLHKSTLNSWKTQLKISCMIPLKVVTYITLMFDCRVWHIISFRSMWSL